MREELARRHLDTTGSNEDLIQRLKADIRSSLKLAPPAEADTSTPTTAAPLMLDPATVQSLSLLFQRLPRPAATGTTLPDLSSSILQFDDSHSDSVNVYDLMTAQRVEQQLASCDDGTTRLIAAGKLKGTARSWHLAFSNQYTTWATWSVAFKDTVPAELTLIEWQEYEYI
ncbi:hypothetical protein HPB48_004704 [Haemaphysalis longicornis]|uniref:SAP domain-containing protein n=1 Tax=Haemaphysalis longicornis TaxID=44386 RepID=A0A9J6G0D2_HAELO|nr:hypothetical protein HPB48_004704 [Haemaphysalis longicornis]